MKKVLALLVVAAAFSSCQTAAGVGRDLRVLGGSMENAADRAATSSASSAH